MTHAFFKPCYSWCPAWYQALAGEHDVFKMGGLRPSCPRVPDLRHRRGAPRALPSSRRFYSKDLIIAASLGSVDGSAWLYAGALVGAFVTALYSFRLVWLVFFGQRHTEVTRRPRRRQVLPLWVLAVLAVVGGFVWMPAWLGGFDPLRRLLDTALPEVDWSESLGHFAESAVAAFITIAVVLSGVGLSYLLWMPWRQGTRAFAASPAVRPLAAFWLGGWGFDWLYERVFVRPVKWFAHWARHDLVDYVVGGVAWLNLAGWRTLSAGQNGRLRGYVAVAGFGVVLVLAVVVLR